MSKTTSTTLYIVRHGQSEGNISGILEGHAKVVLTDLGREQARVTKNKLQSIEFDKAFSSDLPRAQQTAKIILQDRHIPFQTTPLLRERHYGVAEGKTEEFLKDQMLQRESLIMAADEKTRVKLQPVKDMESDAEVLNRVIPYLQEKVNENKGKTLLIVTHGNLMRTLLVYLGFGNYRELGTGIVKNAAYIKVKAKGNKFIVEDTYNIEKRLKGRKDKLLDFMRFHSHII